MDYKGKIHNPMSEMDSFPSDFNILINELQVGPRYIGQVTGFTSWAELDAVLQFEMQWQIGGRCTHPSRLFHKDTDVKDADPEWRWKHEVCLSNDQHLIETLGTDLQAVKIKWWRWAMDRLAVKEEQSWKGADSELL